MSRRYEDGGPKTAYSNIEVGQLAQCSFLAFADFDGTVSGGQRRVRQDQGYAHHLGRETPVELTMDQRDFLIDQ